MAIARTSKSPTALKRENTALRRELAQARTLALAAGGENIDTLNYLLQTRTEKPDFGSASQVFARCRYFARENAWLNTFLLLKRSLLNAGFKLVAYDPKEPHKPSKDNQSKLDEWLEEDAAAPVDEYTDPQSGDKIEVESNASNYERVIKFIEDAWLDWLVFDAVTAFWRDDQPIALTLQPERVTYTDILGLEVLRYTHGLGQQEIKSLSDDDQKRFAKPTIIINPGEGEHFKVLKRSPVGDGLGVPRMFGIFRLLGEIEGKEAGQNAMGFAMRSAKRVHKLGHEIKNGINAGKNSHFITSRRAKAVNERWRDKVGFEDYCCNFDESVEYPWPDSKLFDEKYYSASNMRLDNWAGPLALMLRAKGVSPYLANLLKTEALEERRKMGRFLSYVVSKAFGMDVPVRPMWSNLIFNEARLQAELVKFGYMQGLASATTTREEIGLNPADEEALKVGEADDADAEKKLKPTWDSAHGIAPALGESSVKPTTDGGGAAPAKGKKGKGQAADATNGRPAGSASAPQA